MEGVAATGLCLRPICKNEFGPLVAHKWSSTVSSQISVLAWAGRQIRPRGSGLRPSARTNVAHQVIVLLIIVICSVERSTLEGFTILLPTDRIGTRQATWRERGNNSAGGGGWPTRIRRQQKDVPLPIYSLSDLSFHSFSKFLALYPRYPYHLIFLKVWGPLQDPQLPIGTNFCGSVVFDHDRLTKLG